MVGKCPYSTSHLIHSKHFAPLSSDCNVLGCVWRRRQWHPTPVLLPGKIPWMEEPGGLQSMGSLRVGHDSDFTFTFHFYALGKEMATCSSVFVENPRDGGSWWAAVYGVAQSRTQVKRLSSSRRMHLMTFLFLILWVFLPLWSWRWLSGPAFLFWQLMSSVLGNCLLITSWVIPPCISSFLSCSHFLFPFLECLIYYLNIFDRSFFFF